MTTNQSQALEEASMLECVMAGHKLNNTFHLRMEAIRAVKGGSGRKVGAVTAISIVNQCQCKGCQARARRRLSEQR
eukprot:3114628-Rhodomonas_salina.1